MKNTEIPTTNSNATMEQELRQNVFAAVRNYHDFRHKPRPFIPGVSPVPVSGRVFDDKEMVLLSDASLDFWLTAGRFSDLFEDKFAHRIGVPHALLTNSGSSANLLAVSALTSPMLGEDRLMPGDEVITVAACFPTTVNPIIQNRLTPVFVDVQLGTYNIDVRKLSQALSKKTRAIILAHTLGNPFDVANILEFAKKHDLWVIEDSCDALGSTYQQKWVGGFGDISSYSFYPAHHITMGEGGAVVTSNGRLRQILASFRDWGRDCWCAPGKDNTCGKRFDWKLGGLPSGYDHKYIYSHLGYNLKLTDLQAAVGVAQLDKLDTFIAARKANFKLLREGLRRFEKYLILPEATSGSDPAWFGFPITVRENTPFKRDSLTAYLNDQKIGTRLIFAGNILKQPYFKEVTYRIVGDLSNTDRIMNNSFWVGTYPGITPVMAAYVVDQFDSFFKHIGINPEGD